MSANLTDTLATIRAQAKDDLCRVNGVSENIELGHAKTMLRLQDAGHCILRLTKALEIAVGQRDGVTQDLEQDFPEIEKFSREVDDAEILAALSGEK